MLLIDEFEDRSCPELTALIKQAIPCVVTKLNLSHMSDYYFSNFEGKRFQFSRKQAGELLSDIDEAERQLVDYYENADYNCQIIEGMISPLKLKEVDIKTHESKNKTVSIRDIGATIYGYKFQPNGEVSGHSFKGITASMYYAWIHRLQMAGIPTYTTTNYIETARLLITLYRNEQKAPEEHKTLKRVIIPRLELREADEFVKALMFIGHAYKLDIGDKRAKALAEKFCNIAHLATATVQDVASCDGYGKYMARKLLNALRGVDEE